MGFRGSSFFSRKNFSSVFLMIYSEGRGGHVITACFRDPGRFSGFGPIFPDLGHGSGTARGRFGHGLGTVWALPPLDICCPEHTCSRFLRVLDRIFFLVQMEISYFLTTLKKELY